MAEENLTNSTHPSLHRLEQLAIDELPEGEREAIQEHVASCISCRARLGPLREGFAALPEVDAESLFDRISVAGPDAPLRERSWLPWLMPVTALAAAALLFVVWPKDSPTTDGELRLKGGVSLHIDRSVEGGSTEHLSGDVLHEGDQIRFRISGTLGDAMHVMVLGIEDSGERTVYYPLGKDGSALADPGPQGELRGAVRLDSYVGRETLYLVACPSAFQLAQLEFVEPTPVAPSNCQIDPFILMKE